MRYYFYVILWLIIPVSSFAGVIQGVVKDINTNEVLIGANVFVKGNKSVGTTSGLDGTFVLKNVDEGNCILVCSYISYKTLEKSINVPVSGSQRLTLDLVSFENELNDVMVIASNKTTDIGVRAIERLSSNVLNVVGARAIEISPDLTVANVLGRISGVTLERNSSGEAEYAVLRGMDKRYNITLVNGVKISSPNNKQRFVPLNIFPSELLDRLEVSKTRGAEMEGDATGGAVNMVMKDAPAHLTVRANAATGYNTLFFDRAYQGFDKSKVIPISPYEKNGSNYSATMADFGNGVYAPVETKPLPNITAGVSVGNRFFENKLGFIIAANYQNVNKGTNSVFFKDDMVQTEGTLRLTAIEQRDYSENQILYGAHAKFDYNLSKNHKIEWYNFLVANEVSQVRQTTSTNFKLFYEPGNGNLDLAYQTRMRTTNQQIFASMLQGEHTFSDRVNFKWTAVYSEAGLQRPDLMYINLDNLQQNFVDNVNIDGDGSERRWEHNSDQDISGLAKIEYHLPVNSGKFNFQSGGLFRSKKRDNSFVKYVLKPVDTNQNFETIDQINWTVYNPKASVGPLTYSASEIIAAGYLQARFNRKNLEAIAGLRTEFTNQGYHMFYPNAGEPADQHQIYTDFLPNLQLKYMPNDKINWRASYYRSLNRPGFYEVVPYQVIEEEYTEYGNKNLQRSTIDNIDVRWEFFPKPMDQILVGAFFKNINAPIEFAYFSVNQRQSGYGLQNLGNAQNIGLELDYIKYIRLFGLKANYTYTHSAITTNKVYYGKDESGNTKTYTTDQTRPLVGQAAHVGNISLLFKDVNHGWDAQLAASYSGDKIVIVSRFLDSDYWEKASLQLDLSLEKNFKSGLSVFAKANNLLNTPKIEFLKTHNDYNNQFNYQSAESGETLIRKEYYKQSFLVGVRYKL
jgi:outer membrane receptor protein involved in Fe transport